MSLIDTSFLNDAEDDISTLAFKTEEDVSDLAKQYVASSQSQVEKAEAVTEDAIRGSLKTVNNLSGNLMHSTRFIAKNGIALVDNTQDHIFQLLNSVRVDISNVTSIIAILISVGVASFVILYGDQIMKGNIRLGKITLL